jgi:hypothetical protein
MSQTPADTVREQVSARRAAAGPMVPVLWCLLAALVTLASLPVALRASDSARLARRERARALAVVADVERLQALRASLAAEGAEGAHGTDDEQAGSLTLAARVSAVLAAAGLGQSSLAGLSPQSVVPTFGCRHRPARPGHPDPSVRHAPRGRALHRRVALAPSRVDPDLHRPRARCGGPNQREDHPRLRSPHPRRPRRRVHRLRPPRRPPR